MSVDFARLYLRHHDELAARHIDWQRATGQNVSFSRAYEETEAQAVAWFTNTHVRRRRWRLGRSARR